MSRHLIIVVEESDSTVGFYDSADGSELARVKVGFYPHEIEVSSDFSTAYVSNFGVKDYDENIGRAGSSISVIDIKNMCEVDRLYTFNSIADYEKNKAPHGVKLHPGQPRLYVNVEQEDKILIFNLDDKRLDQKTFSFAAPEIPDAMFAPPPSDEFAVPETTHNFIFSPDGAHLWVFPAKIDGKWAVLKMDSETGEIVASFVSESPIRGLTYSPDGLSLVAFARNEIYIFDSETLELNKRFENLGVGQLLYGCVYDSPQKKRYILAPAVWESQVLVINADTGEVVRRLLTGIDPIQVHLAFGGDTAYVTHGRSYYLSKIDLSDFTVSGRIATKGGPNGIATVPFQSYAEREILRFGACLPLSGPNKTEGREICLGYEYWKESVNLAGGIVAGGKPYFIETQYLDTQSKDADAGVLTKQLIEDYKVDFLLGNYPSPANEEAGRVADAAKVPFVTATGAGERIYDHGFKHVFGIMSPARVYLRGMLEVVARLQPKPETVLFFSCDDFAAKQDADKTAEHARRLGLTVIAPNADQLPSGINLSPEGILVYKHNITDFTEILKIIAETKPDIFLNTGHLPESREMVLQIKALNFTSLALGFSVGPSLGSFRAYLNERGCSPAHLFGPAQWHEKLPLLGRDRFLTPADFARLFFERFSMNASYFSAGAAACGLVYEEALRAADTTDRQAVRDALAKTCFDTFFAHIELDNRGLNDKKPMVTVQIMAIPGHWEEVVLYPPEYVSGGEAVYPFPGF